MQFDNFQIKHSNLIVTNNYKFTIQNLEKLFQTLWLNKITLNFDSQNQGEFNKKLNFNIKSHYLLLEKLNIDSVKIIESYTKTFSVFNLKLIVLNLNNVSNLTYNSLLKTIEEPRGSTYFFLLTNNFSAVPKTIKSRCFTIFDNENIQNIANQDIFYLKNSFNLNYQDLPQNFDLCEYIEIILYNIVKIIKNNTLDKNNCLKDKNSATNYIENQMFFEKQKLSIANQKNTIRLLEDYFFLINIKHQIVTFHLDTASNFELIKNKFNYLHDFL